MRPPSVAHVAAQAQQADPLRALSRSLLQLAEQAQHAPPQDLLHQALQTLRGLVPFDSAWWGEVSAGESGAGGGAQEVQAAPRNWLHGSIGLARGFADEWNALSAADDFAKHSMRHLGEVIRERDLVGAPPEDPQVMAFAERHGLYHCMALTAELPHSGLLFFVSVYRTPTRSEFTDAETVLFGEFVLHLLQHWHHRLQRLQSDSPRRPWDSFALAQPTGELLFAGLRISQALRAAYPEWAGTRLPPAVVQALPGAPCNLALGKACRLRLERCGPLVALSIASRQHKQALAPRELSVAMLYAQGQSHKDIAATLGLTPATVRTYLRTAYAALGVRNKLELVAALRNA
ncbi:MAG: helix-turn-helix transcriptional regulator [Burkholderiales bacterium GWA2_64_37]|nr:MAG: helix-turn-helix transcriptional regulator [Burkholderiales bacterium GWA2_64_37]HCE95095.1 LuxR family transcriptional regulator [Acidovorax sp.]